MRLPTSPGGLWIAALWVLLSGCSSAAPPSDAPPKTSGTRIEIAGGELDVQVTSKPDSISEDQLLQWVRTAARAVAGYYGRYPVKHVEIAVSTTSGGGPINGQTYGNSRIEIEFRPGVRPGDLEDDWVLTHEMFHLAFPDLRQSHLWMNEGLSTYLEPIARARIGTIPVERVWREMVEGLPQGLPEPGDRGLDHTHTWGRTYWGGCLYWFLAEVQIRQQTQNRRSLDDALRRILDEGGDGAARWPVTRVLEVGDRATGTTVLHELYDQMADKPDGVDLDALWRQLGVRYREGRVTFEDAAPLAAVRRAITAPRPE